MKEYIVYRCKICGKHTILLSEEITHSEKESRYITCGHDGMHKNLIVAEAYDGVKECMQERSYKRDKGKVKQIR